MSPLLCWSFEKEKLPFFSLVVYEDFEALGKKERAYLTKNADTQYPALNDFREKSVTDIDRYIRFGLLIRIKWERGKTGEAKRERQDGKKRDAPQ